VRLAIAAGLGASDSDVTDELAGRTRWIFFVDATGVARSAHDAFDSVDRARLAAAVAGIPARPAQQRETMAPRSGGGDESWPTPAFFYRDQDGRLLTNRDLLGQPWIADFIFTRCPGACPMITAALAGVRRRLPSKQLRFISFSVDPAHDTPAVLRSYAARFGGDADPRWRLLSTDHPTIGPLAAGMHALAIEGQSGEGQSGEGQSDEGETSSDKIVHSDRFVLVDAAGMGRGTFDSGDPKAIERLVLAVAALEAGAPPPTAAATGTTAGGAALYQRLGCAGCHDQPGPPRLAPSLAGLLGRVVRLADGRSIQVDERYLRRSILDPAAEVTAGFSPNMPSYASLLLPGDVDQLVAYLRGFDGMRPADLSLPRSTMQRGPSGDRPSGQPLSGWHAQPDRRTPATRACCRNRQATHSKI
jgi:protein SCO1/2